MTKQERREPLGFPPIQPTPHYAAYASGYDEHEITRQAYEKADTIREMSERDARERRMDTEQYVDDILADVEHRLDLLLRKVREDREEHMNN